MEGDHITINRWLIPFSWLYGLGVGIRNLLFDTEVLKSRKFSVPVISVGNITVGGSGKTPHVEYLVKLLHNRVQTAVLSRGYKRKSKGFFLADDNTKMSAESEDFNDGFGAEDEDGTSELESGDLDDYGSSGDDDYNYGDSSSDDDDDYLHDSYTGDVEDDDDLFE